MKIYIVNHHFVTRNAIKSILEKFWDVREFESGDEFLEEINRDSSPAVILFNAEIVNATKGNLAEYIKHHPRFNEFPIIFIAETNDKKLEYTCLKYGAADYISCPLNPEVIFQRVENVVNQHKAYFAMLSEVKRTTHIINDSAETEDKKVIYQVLTSLSATIDAKDYYTKGHSARVAEYSLLIGREIGLPKASLETLYYSALLHDIGKIGVSDIILRKNCKLDDLEYDIIKKHPVIGYNILKTITLIPEIAQGARWHHERYDGCGYPDGLKGLETPLTARIISVADAFDAMTSDRTYRKAMSIEAAKDELISNKEIQFDPYITDIMVKLILMGSINKAMLRENISSSFIEI